MKYRLLLVAVAVLAVSAPSASADSLNVVGDSAWHLFQTPTAAKPAVPGTAFWNNWSIDGSPNNDCNIGYWISGLGGCNAANSTAGLPNFYSDSPNTPAPYLGNEATTFTFQKSAGTESITLTSRVQVSKFAGEGTNEFGWFDASTPTPTLNPLFSGYTLRGATATFVPSGVYGFYLTSPTGTYLTTSGVSSTDWNVAGAPISSQSHFALFQLSGNDHYLFGVEDLNNAWASDWDYNDMAIEMQVNSVPEPATMALLGTGLAGLALARRRRRA